MSTTLALKQWAAGQYLRRRSPHAIPIPELVAGRGSLARLGAVVKKLGVTRALVVTDETLVKLGLAGRCQQALAEAGVAHVLFDAVLPNPSSVLVDEGYALYEREGCDGIIALGGGSPMDCAKVIGLRACNPEMTLEAMVGIGKVNTSRKDAAERCPPLVAIPTTAGTGSEVTVGAIISFPGGGPGGGGQPLKLAISDRLAMPRVAVLDPEVTATLPASVTAATGMDALTHAVESHLSTFATDFTRRHSLRAVERIGRWLQRCVDVPEDLQAREEVGRAAFEAGVAITRTQVGYVHGVAHTFGSFFQVPHGVANAMVMPHVLDFYLRSGVATERLAELAIAIGIASHYDAPGKIATPAAKQALARAFIDRIVAMNATMNLPTHVAKMTADDVPRVVARALQESHEENIVGYPVPKFMAAADFAAVVRACLPPGQAAAAGAEAPRSRL